MLIILIFRKNKNKLNKKDFRVHYRDQRVIFNIAERNYTVCSVRFWGSLR